MAVMLFHPVAMASTDYDVALEQFDKDRKKLCSKLKDVIKPASDAKKVVDGVKLKKVLNDRVE